MSASPPAQATPAKEPPAQTRFRCRECGHTVRGEFAGERCPVDGHGLVVERALESFPQDPLLGRVLDGRLVIFDVLSDQGGFNLVYRAVQQPLGRMVVVKTARPELDEERTQYRARFLQEAKLLAELKHPAIVGVHEVIEPDEGPMLMVLELAPGRPLAHLMDEEGPLPASRAVSIAREILQALQAAHEHALVHRDLKPPNVIVDSVEGGDRVTLIDFGIAKRLSAGADDPATPRTTTGVTLGTPLYMAPEQLQANGTVGPFTDVYAVGVMLFGMLTGEPPFHGSQAEVVAAHLYEPAPSLLDRENVPRGLALVVERALAKRGSDRFPTARAMCEALAEVPQLAVAPPVFASAATQPVTAEVELSGVQSRGRAPGRWGLAAIVGVALLAAAAAFWAASPGPGEPAELAAVPVQVPGATTSPVAVQPVQTAPVVAAAPAPGAGSGDSLQAAEPEQEAAAADPVPTPPKARARRRAPSRKVGDLRAALRACQCARARRLLESLRGTSSFSRLQREVAACRPQLLGQPCNYTPP